MPGRMRDHKLRLDMHCHSLRRDTACPKHRNFPFFDRHRIAEVRMCNVFYTYGFRISDMDRTAVDSGKPWT